MESKGGKEESLSALGDWITPFLAFFLAFSGSPAPASPPDSSTSVSLWVGARTSQWMAWQTWLLGRRGPSCCSGENPLVIPALPLWNTSAIWPFLMALWCPSRAQPVIRLEAILEFTPKILSRSVFECQNQMPGNRDAGEVRVCLRVRKVTKDRLQEGERCWVNFRISVPVSHLGLPSLPAEESSGWCWPPSKAWLEWVGKPTKPYQRGDWVALLSALCPLRREPRTPMSLSKLCFACLFVSFLLLVFLSLFFFKVWEYLSYVCVFTVSILYV